MIPRLPALARALLQAALIAGLYAPAVQAAAAGDAARGEQLHRSCLQCHGTELYVPPRARVTSLKTLQREVKRWADMYNPRFSPQEVEDLVVWLNRDFYRFPVK